MNSLFLLQFACFIFMLINAFIVAVSYLHVRWENKRYERSRWMIVVALLGLAIQYVIQMEFGFLIVGCSRHHRAGPARRTGHLGQSARVTGSIPTRKAALPSTHHGARTEPLFLFPPLRGFCSYLRSRLYWQAAQVPFRGAYRYSKDMMLHA